MQQQNQNLQFQRAEMINDLQKAQETIELLQQKQPQQKPQQSKEGDC